MCSLCRLCNLKVELRPHAIMLSLAGNDVLQVDTALYLLLTAFCPSPFAFFTMNNNHNR